MEKTIWNQWGSKSKNGKNLTFEINKIKRQKIKIYPSWIWANVEMEKNIEIKWDITVLWDKLNHNVVIKKRKAV